MVIITTTPTFEGMPIKEYKGIINTNIVIGTNLFSDFAASFTDVFGGNSGSYQNKMNSMYEAAKKQMQEKAIHLGANAIVGYNIDFDEISGKGKSMFMLSATGTACLVEFKEQKTSIVDEVSNITIPAEKLSILLKGKEVISKIENGELEISDEEWDILYENASIDNAELLISHLYTTNQLRSNVEHYLSLLEKEQVIPIVYNVLKSKKTITSSFNGVVQIIRLPVDKLIKNCRLFDANEIISLMKDDVSLALSVIDAEKDFYTKNDLPLMKELSDIISKLPTKGTVTKGKLSLFAKEEDIWICTNGHKNAMTTDVCPECGLNIKGLSKNEIERIEAFEKRVHLLDKLL